MWRDRDNEMPKLILKKCTQCLLEKARNSNFTFSSTTGYSDVCRTCKSTDPRKKVCTQCGELKSLREYYVKGAAHRLSAECKVCSNKRKHKPKVVEVAPPEIADPAVNAFHWRTFVQPFKPAKDLWVHPRPGQAINTRFRQYG